MSLYQLTDAATHRVMVQMLLYFYKLTLPAPPAPPPVKKKRKRAKTEEPVLNTEDNLELFMDKLSTWQLTEDIDRAAEDLKERDWTQIFTEDIVERQCVSPFCQISLY